MISKTILLADDEDTLRENLAQLLREEGFNVMACRDGSSASKAIRQNNLDAVITDLRMPGLTGMELIDHVRKSAPHAVIIVVTAFGEVETAVEAMRKGVHDYICKPLILDEVIFKLKRLLTQKDLERENRLLKEQVVQRMVSEDGTPFEFDLRMATDEFERRHITAVLAALDWNKAEAAHRLGIGLSSLYRKLDELGIPVDVTNGCPAVG